MSHLPSLGPRGVGWVLLQGILLVLIAASAMVPPAWSGPARIAGAIVGAGLLAVGAWMAVSGGRELGSALTPLPHPRDDAVLVETGIYGRVRHPIYGGLVVSSLGWALIWASVPGLILTVVAWAFFTLKSMREEAWLVERFPGYPDYRARVPRLIPWRG